MRSGGWKKSKDSINVEGRFFFCGGWNFSKSVSVGSTFTREMKVYRIDQTVNILKPSFIERSSDHFPLRNQMDMIFVLKTNSIKPRRKKS